MNKTGIQQSIELEIYDAGELGEERYWFVVCGAAILLPWIVQGEEEGSVVCRTDNIA